MDKLVAVKRAFISLFHDASAGVLFKKLQDAGIEIHTTEAHSEKCAQEQIDVKITTVSEIYQNFENDTANIDLVVVDMPTFKEISTDTEEEGDIFESIDTQHIALMRIAAKNFYDILVIPTIQHLNVLYELLEEDIEKVPFGIRRKMALETFNISSSYDITLYNYFSGAFNTNVFKESISGSKELKYGENPHQKSVFYGDFDAMFEQLHGENFSYNNLLDINSALDLIAEFKQPTAIISKHSIPSGGGSDTTLSGAVLKSISADPVSAFWSTITLNRMVDVKTAAILDRVQFKNLIAPGYHPDALELLKQSDDRILLKQRDVRLRRSHFRTLLNGVVVQDKDFKTETEEDMKVVTKKTPTEKQYEDLIFAGKIVKHTKSNAVVIAKDKRVIANGSGQTSRVDALRLAISKAESYGIELNDCVAVSDAFFPFLDSIEIAANAGIGVILQSEGSEYLDKAIEMCDNNKMSMVIIKSRHFKH